MDADETEIWNFLNTSPGQLFSPAEVSRRASSRQKYMDDPKWAMPVLARMVGQKIIEVDSNGRYRLVQAETQTKTKRWISPHLRKILKESGKEFELDPPEDSKEKEK